MSCLPSLNPPVFLTDNLCVVAANCPIMTYGSLIGNICTPCLSPCKECTAANICINCIQSYILNNTFCYTSCPSGYVNITSICLSCSYPCATCLTSQTICNSCITGLNPPLFLSKQSTCITSFDCDEGTYGDSTTNKC